MKLFSGLCNKNGKLLLEQFSCYNVYNLSFNKPVDLSFSRSFSQGSESPQTTLETEEFRILDLKQKKTNTNVRRKQWKTEVMPPRSMQMPVDQDWPSTWPGPRTFHPASVPLPIRQGYTDKGAPPGKFANAEIMKIPNFLHLTPPAIKRQCEALKQFCTAWPAGLDTETKCNNYFPLEIISSNYCHSSPTIRNPLSRIVTIKVALSSLPLDSHARDKLLRLVGDRYNPTTDIITIVADRCPVQQQNYDFAMYILTALFHEAWKVEPWESEKSEADMEYYDWDNSVSNQSLLNIVNWPVTDPQDNVLGSPQHLEYKEAVAELFNTGEDQFAVERYKEATKKLFSLTESKPNAGL